MPIAKKSKMVSLTKVKPKTRDHKELIVQKVHTYMKQFKNIYVLSYENMTTNNFKALKEQLSDSKFLMGKNKVLSVAFGKDQDTTHKSNSYLLSEYLKSHCAVFFTNRSHEQCQQIFNTFEEQQFATGGTIADNTIILQKGFDTFKNLSHSIEPHLRTLGLSTRLVNSQIELLLDYVLSQEGKPLTVNQCKILKLLGIKMSRLKFNVKAWYDGNKVHV